MASQPRKDYWTHEAYSASASFVPELATKVISWLNPQPEDIILDLGCGDGPLTAKIKERCASVAGFDSSPNLIESARKNYGSVSNLAWFVQDCRYLEECRAVKEGAYTKVFSNAALHWILRDASTRVSVFRGAFRALRPGGELVFEMGGAGNVAEVHAALLAAVVHQGVSIEKAREASPWFFPSEEQMKKILEEVGFIVEKSELEYRPTRLTTEKDGGIEGWTRLMGAQILEVLPSSEEQEAAVREVCDVLKTILTHEEDGSMWLGYVRLRVHARKP
ncbi:SAM-dependent methyltransferase [Physcia stellaris]|nr:SAM-dependent methyltransferase [Physcia stellaris]